MMQVWQAQTDLDKEAAWTVLEKTCPDAKVKITNYFSYKEKVLSKACVFCAGALENPIGMIAFYCNDFDSRTAYLTQFAILPHYQGMGIGKLLMESFETYALEHSMKKIRLEVENDNVIAKNLYRSAGLVFEGEASEKSHYLVKIIK